MEGKKGWWRVPPTHGACGAFALGCRDSYTVCKSRAFALAEAVFKKEIRVVAALYDRRGVSRIGRHKQPRERGRFLSKFMP